MRGSGGGGPDGQNPKRNYMHMRCPGLSPGSSALAVLWRQFPFSQVSQSMAIDEGEEKEKG